MSPAPDRHPAASAASTSATEPATRERGQSTVELVLVLPVVVVAMLAVVQIGVIGHQYLAVWHAARESARAAAVAPDHPTARAAALTAGTALDPARLTVGLRGGTSTGDLITSSLTYRAATDVPVVGRLVGDVTLRAEVTMRVE